MNRMRSLVVGLIIACAGLFAGAGVAVAAPNYSASASAPTVVAGYPVTQGDSSGHPIKACGPGNDGENVSTLTYDINTNTAYTRYFSCKLLSPDTFGNGGGWVWLEIAEA